MRASITRRRERSRRFAPTRIDWSIGLTYTYGHVDFGLKWVDGSDLETLNTTLRHLEQAAAKAGDAATQNLAQGFADGQEKTIWMLRAFLKG